jgi:hypothetical protein
MVKFGVKLRPKIQGMAYSKGDGSITLYHSSPRMQAQIFAPNPDGSILIFDLEKARLK